MRKQTMKVLIVDDSKMSRKLLQRALPNRFGKIAILEAENGQVALDIVKSNVPDIIFLDLTMPVMDGYEALKLIQDFDKSIPVVVVSADVQAGAIDIVLQQGARKHITKPINKEKINQIFDTVFLKAS